MTRPAFSTDGPREGPGGPERIPPLSAHQSSRRSARSRRPWPEAAALDADFHWRLVSESPNSTLRALTRGLIDRSREVSLAFDSLPDAAKQSLEQHESILEALAAGDVGEAADRMLAHDL